MQFVRQNVTKKPNQYHIVLKRGKENVEGDGHTVREEYAIDVGFVNGGGVVKKKNIAI